MGQNSCQPEEIPASRNQLCPLRCSYLAIERLLPSPNALPSPIPAATHTCFIMLGALNMRGGPAAKLWISGLCAMLARGHAWIVGNVPRLPESARARGHAPTPGILPRAVAPRCSLNDARDQVWQSMPTKRRLRPAKDFLAVTPCPAIASLPFGVRPDGHRYRAAPAGRNACCFSSTCPASITRIMSAARMVDKRCAITIVVRSTIKASSAVRTRSSLTVSRCEVASSRTG